MKKILTIIIILVIVAIGFIYFSQSNVPLTEQSPAYDSNNTKVSETEVLDQIAADVNSQEPVNVDDAFKSVDEALNNL